MGDTDQMIVAVVSYCVSEQSIVLLQPNLRFVSKWNLARTNYRIGRMFSLPVLSKFFRCMHNNLIAWRTTRRVNAKRPTLPSIVVAGKEGPW